MSDLHGDMWSNCFSIVLVLSRLPVFQYCKEILFAPSWSLNGDVNKPFIIYQQFSANRMSFHRQVGRVTCQISIQPAKLSVCHSSGHSDGVCYIFWDYHIITVDRIATIQFLLDWSNLNRLLMLTCRPCSSSLLAAYQLIVYYSQLYLQFFYFKITAADNSPTDKPV